MCLFPRKMINRKYTVTEKNGGCVPSMPIIGYDQERQPIYDTRVATVFIPCGHCIECREAKAREWAIRLMEEIKDWEYRYFVTLTFSPQKLGKLMRETGLPQCNAIATKAIRRSLERYRKDHKVSLRHWFITEMGHEGTERIHMHGIILNDKPMEFTKSKQDHMMHWKYWQYGLVYVGDYVNARTVSYIVKYMSKIDTDHKGFEGKVHCSPGIGKNWILQHMNEFTYTEGLGASRTYYRNNDGTKVKLPTYWKNKAYNEEEREKIWRDSMDEETTYIGGNEYMDKISGERYGSIYEACREKNGHLGYGDDSGEWRKREYNITDKMLKSEKIPKNSQKNLQISN